MEINWDTANKIGIVFTVVGTVFTVVTYFLVGTLKKQLKKKERLPEAHKTLSDILPVFRRILTDWDETKSQDARELIYSIKGHVQNVRPNLNRLEKNSADKIVILINRRRWFFLKAPVTHDACWDIHGELHTFVALLEGLTKDNEAQRI
jgi:hypothetical protein